jgi:hypothetical protein
MIGAMQSIKMPAPSLAPPGLKPAAWHAARTCSHGLSTFCALEVEAATAAASIERRQITSCPLRMRTSPEHAVAVAHRFIVFNDQAIGTLLWP